MICWKGRCVPGSVLRRREAFPDLSFLSEIPNTAIVLARSRLTTRYLLLWLMHPCVG